MTSYISYIPHTAAAGDLPNDKVKFCYTCKARGWPHEAINFRIIKDGRIRSDGSYEDRSYQIINYFDDRPHKHRPRGNFTK